MKLFDDSNNNPITINNVFSHFFLFSASKSYLEIFIECSLVCSTHIELMLLLWFYWSTLTKCYFMLKIIIITIKSVDQKKPPFALQSPIINNNETANEFSESICFWANTSIHGEYFIFQYCLNANSSTLCVCKRVIIASTLYFHRWAILNTRQYTHEEHHTHTNCFHCIVHKSSRNLFIWLCSMWFSKLLCFNGTSIQV